MGKSSRFVFWRGIRRVGLLIFYFVLGGGLAALAYVGPFNGFSTGAAVLAGLLGGALLVGLWLAVFRLEARGVAARARKLHFGLATAPLALALLAGAATLYLRYATGAILPTGESRLANFERLWRAVDRNYPYFVEKGVDWPALRELYRARVEAAGDDAAYDAVIADLLAELKDGHTRLSSPVNSARFGRVEEIEGYAVVVETGPSAEAAGLQRGDVILKVGGLEIDPALETLPAPLRVSSSPWNSRAAAMQYLLWLPPGGELVVTWEKPSGEQVTATLTPARTPPRQEPPPVISARRLASGVGVIRVRQLWGAGDLLAEFDAALDGLLDAPGIILDLRGNGGGDSVLGDRMAGRFMARPFTYGVDAYRQRLPQHLFRSSAPMSVSPREPIYSGRLVVLVDELVFSSAEWMLAALVDSGRATLVGSRTGGGSGNPIRFNLPGGGAAQFSSGRFTRSNGLLIEGVGFEPDVAVKMTLADFRAGLDPALTAAEQIVLQAR